jgi:hypothetical protein
MNDRLPLTVQPPAILSPVIVAPAERGIAAVRPPGPQTSRSLPSSQSLQSSRPPRSPRRARRANPGVLRILSDRLRARRPP